MIQYVLGDDDGKPYVMASENGLAAYGDSKLSATKSLEELQGLRAVSPLVEEVRKAVVDDDPERATRAEWHLWRDTLIKIASGSVPDPKAAAREVLLSCQWFFRRY